MDRYVIPGRLDEPERIGLWTIDEFVALAGPFVMGILVQHIIWGICFGILGWWVLRKAKAGRAGSWLIDRKGVVSGKSVSVSVNLGGRRLLKKTNVDKSTSHTL